MEGGQRLIDHFHERYGMRIKTVGVDKRYFTKSFLAALFNRRITPHIVANTTGRRAVHQ